MKCQHCSSEWKTEKQFSVCPFCGKKIAPEGDFSTMEGMLKYIVATHGVETYIHSSRLMSYLGDYAPQLSNERRLVKMCADSGIIRDMVGAGACAAEERQIIINKSISKLEDAYFLQPEWAEKVVYWIAGSLSWENQKPAAVTVVQKETVPVQQNPAVRLVLNRGTDNQADYVGEAVNGVPEGYGKATYKDGCTYEGQWYQGICHGHGRLVYANGDIYEGDFLKGKENGRGKFLTYNGNYYEGDFFNGQFNGKGMFRFKDGSYYEGEFMNCQFHGYGRQVFANGSTYEGEFLNHKRNGYGKYVFKGGAYYEGDFKDDAFHGYGHRVYADGSTYEGEFREGTPV